MARAEPKDPRSTYRRRAQKVLEREGRPKWCRKCGRSPVDPKAPGGMYPAMGTLQVQHINKEISDCDPVNLEYLCPSCHKEEDSQTAKGVSLKTDEFGYGINLLG